MSDVSGRQIKIQHDKRNSGGHTAIADEAISTGLIEVVESISLSDLMRRTDCDSVDLLKSDIEGSEFDVFLNTPAEDLSRIRRLVMEVHLSERHPPVQLARMITHLEWAGFVVTLSPGIVWTIEPIRFGKIFSLRQRDRPNKPPVSAHLSDQAKPDSESHSNGQTDSFRRRAGQCLRK